MRIYPSRCSNIGAKLFACGILTFFLITAFILLISAGPTYAQNCQYWIAPLPGGSDDHPGTFAAPWATLEHAANNVPDSQCTIWIQDGLYLGINNLTTRFSTPTTFKAVNPYKAIFEHSDTIIRVNGARNIIIEGFEFRHSGPDAIRFLIHVDRADDVRSEDITLRNNIFHDSYGNDLLKIRDGVRFATVENNIFYNQGEGEHHIDVNGVTDIDIQDNIFFNDFVGSGRNNNNATKHFIIVKDSNDTPDGVEGSERINIRRNIFLSWEGGIEEFIKAGNDGRPFHEAEDIRIENNLMIGNTANPIGAAFGVSGAKNITFTNNTIVGDLPSKAYAFRVSIKEENPQNENIFFYNNIWADPTGSMGQELADNSGRFSLGGTDETRNLILDNNLYWNGSEPVPPGNLVSPLKNDPRRLVSDPLLNPHQPSIILPRWDGSAFSSGNRHIREEFERLVEQYAKIPVDSPVIGKADPTYAPSEDILNRRRTASPDLGAYEYAMTLTGTSALTTIWLSWSPSQEPDATTLAISYTLKTTPLLVTGIPTTTVVYSLTGLLPRSSYTITLTARDSENKGLAQSNTIMIRTAGHRIFLPITLGATLARLRIL